MNDKNDKTGGTRGTTWKYTYDFGGNIVEKRYWAYDTATATTSLTGGTAIAYGYGDANWKDKLTEFNGKAISYAGNYIGNPTSYGERNYTWEAGRRLKQITMPASGSASYGTMNTNGVTVSHTQSTTDANDTFAIANGMLKVTTNSSNPYALVSGNVVANTTTAMKTVTYAYDAAGLRTQKVVAENSTTTTTDYTLHGKLLMHMQRGTDELHFFYDAQSRPAFVEYGSNLYSYLHNLQGDIVAIVDASGSKVVQYSYDAWGKPTGISGSMATTLGSLNPFRYRGYQYDEETGYYYLRSRYYDPEMGRFINADATIVHNNGIGDHNVYAYCVNNPVSFSDSDGNWWLWDKVKAAAGAVADVITDAATNITTGISKAVANGVDKAQGAWAGITKTAINFVGFTVGGAIVKAMVGVAVASGVGVVGMVAVGLGIIIGGGLYFATSFVGQAIFDNMVGDEINQDEAVKTALGEAGFKMLGPALSTIKTVLPEGHSRAPLADMASKTHTGLDYANKTKELGEALELLKQYRTLQVMQMPSPMLMGKLTMYRDFSLIN